MDDQTCACPKCTCKVNENSIEREGERYCSEACAIQHTDGSEGCGHGCKCGVPQGAL